MVELLILKGVDLNRTTGTGNILAHIAAKESHCDVVDSLLSHGLSIELTNDSEQTVLFFAVNDGSMGLAQLLLDRE
ncbi:Ankyrin-3 like protein [Verticillium longisporum]|nr:Ankyrin-3 like protein [Verticillium longisporum]